MKIGDVYILKAYREELDIYYAKNHTGMEKSEYFRCSVKILDISTDDVIRYLWLSRSNLVDEMTIYNFNSVFEYSNKLTELNMIKEIIE